MRRKEKEIIIKRKEFVNTKINITSQLDFEEKEMAERFGDCDFFGFLILYRFMSNKYLEYIRDLCNYLLDSKDSELEVPEEINDYASSIEDDILRDLRRIRANFLVEWYNKRG
ncbi:MAG: hypothetical protein J6Q48_07830 [Bacteroidaceae bacterium]|nr:hypothetical protein [Bacteroidaceae bacterium]